MIIQLDRILLRLHLEHRKVTLHQERIYKSSVFFLGGLGVDFGPKVINRTTIWRLIFANFPLFSNP